MPPRTQLLQFLRRPAFGSGNASVVSVSYGG